MKKQLMRSGRDKRLRVFVLGWPIIWIWIRLSFKSFGVFLLAVTELEL